MPTSTLRPSGMQVSGSSVRTGGTSKHGVLADNSDSTYLQGGDPSGELENQTYDEFALTDLPAQPTGAKVTSLEVRLRGAEIPDYSGPGLHLDGEAEIQYLDVEANNAIGITEDEWFFDPPKTKVVTFSHTTKRPDGTYWTWSAVNALRMRLRLRPRVHELYVDVIYNERPVATATNPSGTVADTTRPSVTYTYSDPENDAQAARRLKIFSAAQFQAAGFDPETTPATYDTGKEYNTHGTFDLDVDLPNNTLYRAYVKVFQSYHEEHASAWAYTEFTIAVLDPNPPDVVATTEAASGRVKLVTSGHDNLLSANAASIETDATGWNPLLNCSIARSTAQARYGGASLAMTATAAGDMVAETGLFPIAQGQLYTALESFRAAATGRQTRIEVNWFDSAGAFLFGTLAMLVTDTTTGWVQSLMEMIPPAGATQARVLATVLAAAAGEVHHVDGAGLFPGSVLTWAPGGFAQMSTFVIEYSDDDGTTWWRHPRMGGAHDGVATQKRTDYDYELPSGVGRRYRAKTHLVSPAVASAWSAESVEQSIVFVTWWVKVPADMSLNFVPMRTFTFMEREYDLRTAVHDRSGKTNRMVTRGVPSGADFTLGLTTETRADHDVVDRALKANLPLLVQSPYGRQWYIAPAGKLKVRELLIGQTDPNVTAVVHRFELPVVEIGPT